MFELTRSLSFKRLLSARERERASEVRGRMDGRMDARRYSNVRHVESRFPFEFRPCSIDNSGPEREDGGGAVPDAA